MITTVSFVEDFQQRIGRSVGPLLQSSAGNRHGWIAV
jgi:hypothetical protein